MLEFLSENIYELCIGVAVILSTFFGKKRKLSAEEKATAKAEKIRIKGEKATAKAQKLADKLKELQGEEENA
jgi:hypothetical protein